MVTSFRYEEFDSASPDTAASWSYITRLTWFGERADWSHDGMKILFLEKPFGDVSEVLVECDRQNGKGANFVDIWRLKLDGSGQMARLTYFSDFPGFKSSNPAVSDDGRLMAFQMAKSKDAAGVGYGIFKYDFQHAKDSK